MPRELAGTVLEAGRVERIVEPVAELDGLPDARRLVALAA